MGAVTTLEAVRDAAADVYPRKYLEGCETGLVLFAAAFMGQQDALWLHDAGVTATCVDHDADFLDRMQGLYPSDWYFVCADVYEYADAVRGKWDVVSVDSPTNHFERCADMVAVFCSLARRLVILGVGTDTQVDAPDGWEVVETIKRSEFEGGVYWAVLCRT